MDGLEWHREIRCSGEPDFRREDRDQSACSDGPEEDETRSARCDGARGIERGERRGREIARGVAQARFAGVSVKLCFFARFFGASASMPGFIGIFWDGRLPSL